MQLRYTIYLINKIKFLLRILIVYAKSVDFDRLLLIDISSTSREKKDVLAKFGPGFRVSSGLFICGFRCFLVPI